MTQRDNVAFVFEPLAAFDGCDRRNKLNDHFIRRYKWSQSATIKIARYAPENNSSHPHSKMTKNMLDSTISTSKYEISMANVPNEFNRW